MYWENHSHHNELQEIRGKGKIHSKSKHDGFQPGYWQFKWSIGSSEKDFVSELLKLICKLDEDDHTKGEAGAEYDFSGIQLSNLSRYADTFFFKQKALERENKI